MAEDSRANRYAAEGGFYYPRWRDIPHYYGDVVRMLLLGTTVLMLVGAPFYADDLPSELPFIVAGAVAFVALAALTNPRNKMVMRLNAAVSGAGAVLFELWALGGYGTSEALAFVLREVPAVLLFFAFYFSLKTLRAMIMGMVGESYDEFTSKTDMAENLDKSFDESIESSPSGFDEHMEPTDDGLGHTPAPEDDRGGGTN